MSRLTRLSQIAGILAKHGFASRFESEQNRKPAADRFCELLEELGSTFIKMGQMLSARSDLLPPDFIKALSRLQSAAPEFDFKQAKIDPSLFKRIDPKPLASASVAQVHRAVLHTGEEVVIKILRPGIREQVRADTALLLTILQVLEWLVQEVSEFQARDLAAELSRSLTEELDFKNEAKNLQAFSELNADRPMVKVPKFYPELSSSEILVMEHIEGRSIADFHDDKNQGEKLLETILELEFLQVFSDGLFHADPHPGNILVTPQGQVAFIDFGAMGRLARDHQDRLLAILMALALRDPDTLARQLIYLGNPPERVNIQRFKEVIRRLLDQYAGLSISSIEAGFILSDMLSAAFEFKIRLPKEFALLTRMTMTLEGIVRLLHPGLNVSGRLAEHAKTLLFERLDPRNFQGAGLKTALQLAMLAQDLPAQVNQTLSDLERGEVQIGVVSEDLVRLERTLRVLAFSVMTGFVTMALILGGFIMFERYPESSVILWILTGCLNFLTAGWIFTGGKLPKISLRKACILFRSKLKIDTWHI
jgi:ubiquinone biosynthesis protein